MSKKQKRIGVIGLVGKSDFMKVNHFANVGETLLVQDMHIEYGGKGFNQAIAAKRFGSLVTFITKMGNDEIKEKTIQVLEQEHLDYKILANENSTSAEACIMTDTNGDNEVICYPGKNVTLTRGEVQSLEDVIKTFDYLLLQFELSLESLYEAIEIASKYNVKIILNPAPYREINQDILNKCYLITPNEGEALKLFNLKEITEENILALPYENIIITLGDKGSLVKEKDQVILIPALQVKAVDTTGAGDTYNGILASALLQGYDLKDAVKLATIGSGLSVTKEYVFDAIPNKDEVLNYFKKS